MDNHRYSIGIKPAMVGMEAMIWDHKTKEMKTNEGNMFQVINWINKNVDLSESVAIMQDVDMITIKFVLWNNLKEKLPTYMKYITWKLGSKFIKRIPEKFDDVDLQVFFFDVVEKVSEAAQKKAVIKIITEAFKMRKVVVISCENTALEDKVKEKIRFDLPSLSMKGGPNDNIFLINKSKQ